MSKKAQEWFERAIPNHGHRHLILAIAMSILTLSAAFGAAFYAGRERAQAEINGWFDKCGFWWPFAPLMTLHIVERAALISFFVTWG